jgi:hypothetical protein
MTACRKPLGYSLLLVSCLAWAALPIIPFLPYAGAQLVAWAAVTFIFAEITWWLAVVLLGPELLGWFRGCWQKCKALLPGRRD